MTKFGQILTLIFLVLKLMGHIAWSWWLVVAPIPLSFVAQWICVVAYIFVIEIWGSKEQRVALRLKGYIKW